MKNFKFQEKVVILIFLIFVFLLSLTKNIPAYKYDCSLSIDEICNSNDILCQIQYYTCCPISNLKREQDCIECQGYWYYNSCHLEAKTNLTLGDVDGKGGINIVDALFVARYIVGLSVSDFDASAADVNCNGEVNIVDALFIARKAVGLPVTGWCGD